MAEQQHPITPQPELRQLWIQQARRMDPHDPVAWLEHVATQAARWGADAELEACCEWLTSHFHGRKEWGDELRATRRPKPPSLAEEARGELDRLIALISSKGALAMAEPIRRALERLQELEKLHDDQG